MNAPFYNRHPSFSLVERDLRWLAWIARHGPQSSEFLYHATTDTHRCKDTALRRLQALRAADYLRLPAQQWQIAKADFNPYVYDLTPLGIDALKEANLWQNDVRPTGHWWHGFGVSSITSAIEISAWTSGREYIPARRILDRADVKIGIRTRKGTLIADQLFALRSPDGYRVYLLEYDRGTEPIQSSKARKSLRRAYAQYAEVLSSGTARRHFGLKAPVLGFWVFASRRRSRQFESMIQAGDGALEPGLLVRDVPDGFPRLSRWSNLI